MKRLRATVTAVLGTHVQWVCTYCGAGYVAYVDLMAHIAAEH